MKTVLNHEQILSILKRAEELKEKLDKVPTYPRTFVSTRLPDDHPMMNYKPEFPNKMTLVKLRGYN